MIFTAFCPGAFNMCGPLDVQVGVLDFKVHPKRRQVTEDMTGLPERYVAMGLASNQTWLEIHCKYGGFSVKYCEIN